MALETIPKRRRTKRRAHDGPPRVIGYLRVSTDEQADNGLGMDAQRAAIEREAAIREWQDIQWIEDAGQSAKSLARPGLREALRRLEDGEADILAVAKLDRLSRSVHDFSDLAHRALSGGWSLRILDLGLDMTTPQGEMMANILATFAQFERRMIGERTKVALGRLKAQGKRLGNPKMRQVSDEVRDMIRAMRAERPKPSYSEIARRLNAKGIPSPQAGRADRRGGTGQVSGKWWPSSVRTILDGK